MRISDWSSDVCSSDLLAVVAAAAGTIGAEVFGLPLIVGTLLLIGAIVGVTSFGNRGAEQLFKYASSFIYLTYALFLVLALTSFGDRIGPAFALYVPADGWALGGVPYASYNVVAVVAVHDRKSVGEGTRVSVRVGLGC